MISLVQSIDQKKARLDALRPLRVESIRSLMEALDVELVYSSNAVEGNTLTLQETTAVLLHGVTVAGKPLKDHLEAVHLASAWQRVKELAQASGPLTESELLELHTLVLGKDDSAAGHYRSVPVFIRGSKHVPPNALKVSDKMTALFRR
jgi:Fic family protein